MLGLNPLNRALATSLVMLAVSVPLTGCGEESSEGSEERGTTAEAVDVTLIVARPIDGDAVQGKSIVVAGTASPSDATVTIDGATVETDPDGSFEQRVALAEAGENVILVKAAKGTARDRASIRVTRRRTARELAAARKRRREARARRIASLHANAKPIDPRQLQKNPDKFAGQEIVISGEIFQIQESGGQNFFLFTTGCETEFEVRICDGPEVYVTYDISTNATEDAFVTVYGVVRGGYDYETAIGGTNYVAHVEAEIIDE